MHKLTTQDLTPFYRNTIGIDRLMESLISRSINEPNNYPPYNVIVVDEDRYIIEVAIAGFSEDAINITSHNEQLIIKGEKQADERTFHHQGIGGRKFKRVFDLADYVEVQSASLTDGILVIELERNIPESLQPKEIKISSKLIELE